VLCLVWAGPCDCFAVSAKLVINGISCPLGKDLISCFPQISCLPEISWCPSGSSFTSFIDQHQTLVGACCSVS
jgi:hypothetical protein